MKRKSIISVLTIFFAAFSAFGVNEASANVYCDGAPRCANATMYKGDQYIASGSIYLYAGETAKIEFETGDYSVHHVSFTAYGPGGTQATPWQYAGYAGGGDYYYWDVKTTGYYYLFAACAGGDATSCTGGGFIRKW